MEDGDLDAARAGSASQPFRRGSFVAHPRIPGIARVAAVGDARLRVEWFDSVSRPVVLDQWVLAADCSPCVLAGREPAGMSRQVLE
jgi:hypothetical protein